MMKGVLFMTQINFRIEEDIKENAEKALKDMGLTMSSAMTLSNIYTDSGKHTTD